MNVAFSPAAETDLVDIALYIAQDNPKRALSFVDELEAKCAVLGEAPGIARRGPNLAKGSDRCRTAAI